MAADGGRPVVGAEFEEVGIVDETRDHLLHVDRPLVVHRHHAQQLFGVVARRLEVAHLERLRGPVDLPQHLAGDAHRVAVVLGQVVAQTRDAGVHLGAAQLFFGGHLAGGGLQQRRAGQEGPRAAAHHDDVVGQAGLVGAARGRRAVGDGDHRRAGGRHARQVAKQRAAAHETLNPVLQQVGAGALDQLHVGQAVFQREFLDAQRLLQAAGLHRTGVDTRIAGHHHAADAGDEADAADHATAGHGLAGVGRVQAVASQRAQFEPGRAGVEQQRQPLAGQQLATRFEALARRVAGGHRAALGVADAFDQRQHAGTVGGEGFAAGRHGGFDDGHLRFQLSAFRSRAAAQPGLS